MIKYFLYAFLLVCLVKNDSVAQQQICKTFFKSYDFNTANAEILERGKVIIDGKDGNFWAAKDLNDKTSFLKINTEGTILAQFTYDFLENSKETITALTLDNNEILSGYGSGSKSNRFYFQISLITNQVVKLNIFSNNLSNTFVNSLNNINIEKDSLAKKSIILSYFDNYGKQTKRIEYKNNTFQTLNHFHYLVLNDGFLLCAYDEVLKNTILLKTDKNFDIKWSRAIKGLQVVDNNYLVTDREGSIYIWGATQNLSSAALVKLDKNGKFSTPCDFLENISFQRNDLPLNGQKSNIQTQSLDFTNSNTKIPTFTTPKYFIKEQCECGANCTLEAKLNTDWIKVKKDQTQKVTLNVKNAKGKVSYLWLPKIGLSCYDCPNPIVAPKSTIVYSVEAKDSTGCISKALLIGYVEKVDCALNLEIEPNYVIGIGESVKISTNVKNAKGKLTYNWNPKTALSCSDCANPIASPKESTTYILEVQDSLGCLERVGTTVKIDCAAKVNIPKSFTPNDDKVNDFFGISSYNQCIQKVKKQQVWSKKGELLFLQSDFLVNEGEKYWDGKFQGKPCLPDNYTYLIEVLLYDGSVEQFRGEVTLSR